MTLFKLRSKLKLRHTRLQKVTKKLQNITSGEKLCTLTVYRVLTVALPVYIVFDRVRLCSLCVILSADH